MLFLSRSSVMLFCWFNPSVHLIFGIGPPWREQRWKIKKPSEGVGCGCRRLFPSPIVRLEDTREC
jgi:hypothetical protein